MGFLSFNENYYRRELEKLENKHLSPADLTEAKQALKVLDDLDDEGYHNLSEYLEEKISCLSRLRRLIRDAGEEPFKVIHPALPETTYSNEEFELSGLSDRFISDSAGVPRSQNPFLREIKSFCEWLGHDDDTAYIFLFRDALLPYVFCKTRGMKNLHPWLISRRFIAGVTGLEDIDDELRRPIYTSLEDGYTDFDSFQAYCRERILSALDEHTELRDILKNLLSTIKEPSIIVVESGYCGTIPLTLSALDDRVKFRMYTTAPFLYETYRENIFRKSYENMRMFETLCSQDTLLKYSSFKNGRFMVNLADSPEVIQMSLSEIKYMSE